MIYSTPCGDSSTSAPAAPPRSTPSGPLAGSASASPLVEGHLLPPQVEGGGAAWAHLEKSPSPPRGLLPPMPMPTDGDVGRGRFDELAYKSVAVLLRSSHPNLMVSELELQAAN
ncbi:hypothetical protein ZWY2020_032720 [Hordeum vulgare]|nr:hypothetical protein ZWY2020_032720 [Hordeum vulgare]